MFVRPFDSYDNTDKEGYGKRGGQDLVLIKLEKKTKSDPITYSKNSLFVA